MPRVKEEMVDRPVAATVPSARADLLALFVRHGFAGFPVVKEGSPKLVGLVTRQDLFDSPDESQTAILMDPNPATTYPEAPVREAARLMVERRLRVLPVINGVNDLVGVLTPRELLQSLPPPRGHLAGHLRRRFVPVHRATPAPVALEILRSTRSVALPVLGDDGRYVGLLPDAEFLSHARANERVVQTPGGADGDAWTWEAVRDPSEVRRTDRLEIPPVPVAELMRADVPTAGPNATVAEIVDTLLRRGLHQVPVVDAEGRMVDLLSDVDLLALAGP